MAITVELLSTAFLLLSAAQFENWLVAVALKPRNDQPFLTFLAWKRKMGRISSEASGISHKSQDIKKYMNLFISRAASDIISRRLTYDAIVGAEMFAAYEKVLKDAFDAGEIPMGLSLSILKMRKNFEKAEEDVRESDLHTSKSLWRKWGDVKTTIKKTFMPVYEELVAPGEIPTDEQLEAVLQGIRASEEKSNYEAILRAEQQEAAEYGSSNISRLKSTRVHANWIPAEWLTFIKLGPPAGLYSAEVFGEKKVNGKKRKGKTGGVDGEEEVAEDSLSALAGSSSSSSFIRKKIKNDLLTTTDVRKSTKIAKYQSKAEINESLKEGRRQRKLAAAEVAIYRYNVALSARKDRIEESKVRSDPFYSTVNVL